MATRPTHIAQKQGNSGQLLHIKANYFALNSKIKWQIYHYHVDFSPEIESASFRNALLVRQREILGSFLYDRGASIYMTRLLEREETEIVTRDRDDREILIRIRRVEIISPLENRSIQVQNIIVKKALKELNLDRIGRDYFDSGAKVSMPMLIDFFPSIFMCVFVVFLTLELYYLFQIHWKPMMTD